MTWKDRQYGWKELTETKGSQPLDETITISLIEYNELKFLQTVKAWDAEQKQILSSFLCLLEVSIV